VNNQIVNFDEIKECFKRTVSNLNGNVESDIDDFGRESVVWLDNSYHPSDELESAYNWYLPSIKACLKYMNDEKKYKTGIGLTVKIVSMFGKGIINIGNLQQ
jgi:hypothetical protein